MEEARWKRVQELFDAAADMGPAARRLYLALHCGDDIELRAAVERLLSADDSAEQQDFLKDPVRSAAIELAREITWDGRQIGPWRIIRELGRGGMGAVYLAERIDAPAASPVAIKLVRSLFPDPDLQRRFEAERRILAGLQHSGIPRFLDGGTTTDGTPYLVMEYVDGEAITTWAEKRRLPLPARLRLLLEVCNAVTHAHNARIVHRDIKPLNVLVDQTGRARLVDFGIAKPLGPDATAQATTLFRRLTPSYASPEQLRGQPVTVATDVYALGLLLYELIAGAHPFALPGVNGAEVQRRILQDDPAPPCTVAHRRTALLNLSDGMAADLDAITLKALRKLATDRHMSVTHFADDVSRALAGRPIGTRPAAPTYRISW